MKAMMSPVACIKEHKMCGSKTSLKYHSSEIEPWSGKPRYKIPEAALDDLQTCMYTIPCKRARSFRIIKVSTTTDSIRLNST